MKKAIYAGSFDPVTFGHLNIIERASGMFDEVIVLVADSARKKYMFSAPERAELLKIETKSWRNVKVDLHRGMTIEYARSQGALILLRSMRHYSDWELEITMAHANKKLDEEIETVFLATDPGLAHVSSTMVREIAINHGNLSTFVSANVAKAIQEKVKALEV